MSIMVFKYRGEVTISYDGTSMDTAAKWADVSDGTSADVPGLADNSAHKLTAWLGLPMVGNTEYTIKMDAMPGTRTLKLFNSQGTMLVEAEWVSEEDPEYWEGYRIIYTPTSSGMFYLCATMEMDEWEWSDYNPTSIQLTCSPAPAGTDTRPATVIKTSSGFDSLGLPIRYNTLKDAGVDYADIDAGLVFHAPLASRSATASTGQELTYNGDMEFVTYKGIACMHVDGNAQYATAARSSDIPTGSHPFTLCAWLNPAEIKNSSILGIGSHAAKQDALLWMENVGVLGINLYNEGWGPFGVQTGTWYFIAAAYDGMNMRLRMNGVDSIKARTLAISDYPISIGRLPGGSYYFNGYIAGCRIYDRALDTRSIDKLAREYTPTA